MIEFGDDLLFDFPLCIFGQNGVDLIDPGTGHHGIHEIQTLFPQQGLVGTVSAGYGCPGKRFVQFFAAFSVPFDQLDIHPGIQQDFCQIVCHAAAADDHDIVAAVRLDADRAEELFCFSGHGDDGQDISFFHHVIAARDRDLASPVCDTDQDTLLDMRCDFHQGASEPV